MSRPRGGTVDSITVLSHLPDPAISWAELAAFMALYEATVRLRPPTPNERRAYRRANEMLRSPVELPIPSFLL